MIPRWLILTAALAGIASSGRAAEPDTSRAGEMPRRPRPAASAPT